MTKSELEVEVKLVTNIYLTTLLKTLHLSQIRLPDLLVVLLQLSLTETNISVHSSHHIPPETLNCVLGGSFLLTQLSPTAILE
jgi:hypothetical protein